MLPIKTQLKKDSSSSVLEENNDCLQKPAPTTSKNPTVGLSSLHVATDTNKFDRKIKEKSYYDFVNECSNPHDSRKQHPRRNSTTYINSSCSSMDDIFGALDTEEFVQQQLTLWRRIAEEQQGQDKTSKCNMGTTDECHGELDDKKCTASRTLSTSTLGTTATNATVASVLSTSSSTSSYAGIERDDADADAESILQYLQNPEIIREQQRILEQIQKNNTSVISSVKEPLPSPSSPYRDGDATQNYDSSNSPMEQLRTNNNNNKNNDMINTNNQNKTNNSNNDNSNNNGIEESSTTTARIGENKFRIMGTHHAYASIFNGTAQIVKCITCKVLLQVGPSTKLVYCTKCQNVTPIDVARSAVPTTNDSDIAIRLQRQELDIAYVKKLNNMMIPTKNKNINKTKSGKINQTPPAA